MNRYKNLYFQEKEKNKILKKKFNDLKFSYFNSVCDNVSNDDYKEMYENLLKDYNTLNLKYTNEHQITLVIRGNGNEV